jgi:antitoxin component HigA of HigAB toxin-antitoxin module
MDSENMIRTEAEYKAALARAEQLMEDKHHPIEPPDPIAAIHFRMEQEGPT